MKKTYLLLLAAILNVSFAPSLYAEAFELRIPFETGAKALAVREGQPAEEIGTVLKIPKETRYPSYTASAWGEKSAVCASAVNALHLLVSVEKGNGRTISIIPQETIAPAAKAGTAFVLSTTAGTGCFGAWSPKVGSEAVLRNGSGTERELSASEFVRQGETLVIKVKDSELPSFVEIENRPGGRVTICGKNGCTLAGRVLRPLAGTGRFEGTKFQTAGRLRANHPGVIDYSTSENGTIGGFQIIPWDHALTSKEMQHTWNMTQWMIVAPADGKSALGGTAPLFDDGLLPGVNRGEGEKLWDVWSTYGRTSPLLVRINGGAWQPVPKTAGKNDRALENVTHLKIYYPSTEEPAK